MRIGQEGRRPRRHVLGLGVRQAGLGLSQRGRTGRRAEGQAECRELRSSPEIDTRQASDGSYSIAITLNSVTVTGGLTTVIFTAKNAANGADDGNWQVGDFFFNGELRNPPSTTVGDENEDQQ